MVLENVRIGDSPAGAFKSIFHFHSFILSIILTYLCISYTASNFLVISDSLLRTFLPSVSVTAKTEALKHTALISHLMNCQYFETVMHAFEVVGVPVNGSTTNWPAFLSIVTIFFIQNKHFCSGFTARLLLSRRYQNRLQQLAHSEEPG